MKQSRALLFVIRRKQFVIAAVGGIVAGFFLWTIFGAQTIAYDYGAAKTCATSPRLLPALVKSRSSEAFQVNRPASVSVGRFVLYAHSICATSQAPPREQARYAAEEQLFGWPLLARHITVATSSYPTLVSMPDGTTMLPPDAVLPLKLNKTDKTFRYLLSLDESRAPCTAEAVTLRCSLAPLQLAYATKYQATLVRQYKGRTTSLLTTLPIHTITPTTVVQTSIAAGNTVQDKPTGVTLATDKQLASLGAVTLVAKRPDGTETAIPTTSSKEGAAIHVTWQQELPRKTAFELRVAAVKATDGSGFVGTTYTLPFSTSGGPKVVRANIGARNVSPQQTVVITFDQALLAAQAVAPHVMLMVNGTPAPATLTIRGNTVAIKPASALPLCATFSIKISPHLQNQYGIAGDSAWAINSRALCYTTFSIGTSVRGRPLTAYRFGSGPQLILYLGAMHGSEANSKATMEAWFNELNARPERIPAHRSIVIVPSVNPDGVSSGTRFNARGVDLNRNFPANDWKSVVTTPGSPQPSPAGGPHPLSEPESQAVANYIRQTHPRLVMSFHSKAAIVEANEAGDSVAVAAVYASKAGYRAVPKSQSAPIFQYDTTGAMEDWMRDAYGWPAIVVELATNSSSEFARNRDALWYTATL